MPLIFVHRMKVLPGGAEPALRLLIHPGHERKIRFADVEPFQSGKHFRVIDSPADGRIGQDRLQRPRREGI